MRITIPDHIVEAIREYTDLYENVSVGEVVRSVLEVECMGTDNLFDEVFNISFQKARGNK